MVYWLNVGVVVIIDENMQPAGGELFGHEVVKLMRTQLKMYRTVIIGCSGNVDTSTESFLNAGADTVWAKPTPATTNMIQDICKYRASRLHSISAELPGSVSVLVLQDTESLASSLICDLMM
jgi:hypothetical protein